MNAENSVLMTLLAEVLNMPFPRSEEFISDLWRVAPSLC